MLLLDVGNTRLKWAHADAQGIREENAVAHEGDPAAALSVLALDRPDTIWIASVAGAGLETGIRGACLARWHVEPQFARSKAQQLGLRNAYAKPERLGVDRWLAMLAAWCEASTACVVADAGTALTIDVIDDRGEHLGGLIAAGLRTSEQAVLGSTRFPARERALPIHDGLGQDTEACVRQGAMLSCLGALEHVAAQYPQARCHLGGGDASTLLPFLSSRWQARPSMVFEGLLATARAA